MMKLLWSNTYAVGIKTIDEQHKKLIGLINDLETVLHFNYNNRTLHHILNELLKYTFYHFSTEENYFRKYNYPGSEAHISTHTAFQNKIIELKQKMECGDDVQPQVLLSFLKQWFKDHLLEYDKDFALFISSCKH